jgi:hypothetical protein
MPEWSDTNIGNLIKLSRNALEELLEHISEEEIIEQVGQMMGWKRKRVPIKEGTSKIDYFIDMIGTSIPLAKLRELRIIREHSLIYNFKWRLFSFDRSISRYFPEKISWKFEKEALEGRPLVNVDHLVVDEDSETVFCLLERWQNKIVADTFISRVETNIPEYFRAYICIDNKRLLVQYKNDEATKEFCRLFEKTFNVTTEEIRINALVVRSFVKQNIRDIRRLVINVPQEIAGFGGLSELIFEGPNVIAGARGLMTRHETSPINVGPWIGVSNDKIDLDVGQAFGTKDILEVLKLINLIDQL